MFAFMSIGIKRQNFFHFQMAPIFLHSLFLGFYFYHKCRKRQQVNEQLAGNRAIGNCNNSCR